MKIDYIIVGQGLAGSAVAVQLMKRKKSFVVFDDASSNSSSRIAAGLFNPVTGKKMVKTWLADTLFPYLHDFYADIENLTGKRFYYPLPLYRPFVSIEEQNEWMGKSSDENYTSFVDQVHTKKSFPGLNDDFGGLLLKQSGFIDTTEYINAVAILIRQNATLIQDVFHEDVLTMEGDILRYGEYLAKKIIWCSGVTLPKWFDWLPVKGLKGETVSIRNNFPAEIVINRGVYMVPVDQTGVWRVGSTYNFHDKSPTITREGRETLETKIEQLISTPFEIIDHQYGFRPTTPDRRPIMGAHPEHERLVIFNGLGTKGVSLAPYFSEVLVHSLENGGSLNKEVDIKRFKSVYWASPK